MDLALKDDLKKIPDLTHSLRQLRWFRRTLRASFRTLESQHNLKFRIDEAALTGAFLDAVEIIEAQKSAADLDRRDFIVFSAGVFLMEMFKHRPVRLIDNADAREDLPEIIGFWPEGFGYTNYCVCTVAALFEQEFGEAPKVDQSADDLRVWWSYRENVDAVPERAVAFLDRFLGREPNWLLPDFALSRKAIVKALKDSRGPLSLEDGR